MNHIWGFPACGVEENDLCSFDFKFMANKAEFIVCATAM